DEAFEVFKTFGPFDLLLTDVVMPGELLGPALAKAVRQIDPELPCIFLSGYASEATVHGNGLRPSDIRLMKPVSRTDLLHAVSKAISKTHITG
ncbi:MAG: response regulator, partial [Sulfitobacter sp.]